MQTICGVERDTHTACTHTHTHTHAHTRTHTHTHTHAHTHTHTHVCEGSVSISQLFSSAPNPCSFSFPTSSSSFYRNMCVHTCMGTVRPKSKQGNTTNLNISFSMEKEKRAAQVGFKPTTYCLRGRCSTH